MSNLEVGTWDLSDSSLVTPYFDALVKQLVKDVGDDEFENKIKSLKVGDVSTLLEEVSTYFKWLLSSAPREFAQKLYLIDLPEKILKKSLGGHGYDWGKFVDQLVRRELLKVVLRNYYSNL